MIIEKNPKPNPKPGVSPRPCPQELGALASPRTPYTPLGLGITRMRSVCFAQAGDDGNWSHDPSSGGQRPGAAPPRGGLASASGRGALRGAGSPRGSGSAPHKRTRRIGLRLKRRRGAGPSARAAARACLLHPAPCPRTRPAGLLPTARPPARSPRRGPHSHSTSCSLARSSSSLPLRLSASLLSDASVSFSCSPSAAIFAQGRGGREAGMRVSGRRRPGRLAGAQPPPAQRQSPPRARPALRR